MAPELNVTTVTLVSTLSPDFFTDLWKDIIVGAVFLILGAVATYYIVENAVEKRRLGRVRGIARFAIESRLWHIESVLILDLYPLLLKTPRRLKEFVKGSVAQQDRFVWIFEQIEKLIDIYGDFIPEDLQRELIEFGQHAGEFADLLAHLAVNYVVIDELEEWKQFPSNCKNLVHEFEALLERLAREGLVSEDLKQRLRFAKNQIQRRVAA